MTILQRLSSQLRAFRCEERGQSLVEVALASPLLLALVVGTTDVGRYIYLDIAVANSARVASHYAAQNLMLANVTSTGAQVTAAANNEVSDVNATVAVNSSNVCYCYNSSTATFTCSTPVSTRPCNSTSTDHRVTEVHVTASSNFKPLFTYLGFPGSIAVSRTMVAQVTP